MTKTLIGPKLRNLRRLHNETQAEMARKIGVSAAYVNLLENNNRSLSVQVLMTLTEVYGVDAKTLVQNDEARLLSELRDASRDAIFSGEVPDLQELRAALDHAPRLADQFLRLHRYFRVLADHVQSQEATGEGVTRTPQIEIDQYFRASACHFPRLEQAANDIRSRIAGTQDDMYALLKRHLRVEHGFQSELRPLSEMPDSLMQFDEEARHVALSEALDQSNRNFQLAHVIGQIEVGDSVRQMVVEAALESADGPARLEVELMNYLAAAILMPYAPFLALARKTDYDLDRLSASFGVTYEQVCHRLVTLQDPADRAIPFFLVRLDRAGNVTKRFSALPTALAERGGNCPVWNIHQAFQQPSVILPQFIQLPEGARFFTIARTSDRPVFSRSTQDRRVVVALGCASEHAARVTYAQSLNARDPDAYAPMGISCHTCPRQKCAQRAHQPLHMTLTVNSHRRGATRYES
ncbi:MULTISPECIES: helix-turn-helix domain-containing protein [unclassified Marinovum]